MRRQARVVVASVFAALPWIQLAGRLRPRHIPNMSTILSINGQGTLTIPSEVLKQMGIGGVGQVILESDISGQVVLKAYEGRPVEIYDDVRLAEFQEADTELEPYMAKIEAALQKATVP